MSQKVDFPGSSLNTLAQSGTAIWKNKTAILAGKGSDLTNLNSIKGRAKRKLITQKLSLNLVDAAKSKKAIVNEKRYWNTYYCQNRIYTSNGRLYGKYCKKQILHSLLQH